MNAPLILFVDPTEGARSQIARALLAHVAGPGLVVRSAGTQPGGRLDGVAEVLAEIGVPFNASRTPIGDFVSRPPDLLIAVCEEDCPGCPYVPGARAVERMPFEDPAALSGKARTQALRAIRDTLQPRLTALATRMTG